MKPREESYTIHRAYSCGMCDHGEWISGRIVTPTHLVDAYSQDGHTRLATVHRGHHCILTIPRRMTARGMARVAARWVRKLGAAKP